MSIVSMLEIAKKSIEYGRTKNALDAIDVAINAAAELEESAPSASTNTASLKLPTYEEIVASIEHDQNDCFKLTQDHYSGMRRCYDFICRQLQA